MKRCSASSRMLASLAAATMLSGCAQFLSESGPSRSAVLQDASVTAPVSAPDAPYVLVGLTDATLDRLGPPAPDPHFDFAPVFDESRPGSVGIGDDVGVTIFESAAGGLFTPAEPGAQNGNYVTLPVQQVDDEGEIAIPFAGRIRAAHLSPHEIERRIEANLRGRALEPQAVVSVLSRRADAISVLGDVGSATRFSLDPGGERVLGAIARAGGPRSEAWETDLTLQRQGAVQHANLAALAEDPSQDIQLAPGDILYVAHKPRYFLALGATGQTTTIGLLDRRLPFGDLHLSLADALAKAGGLEDDRANARAVFLYRFERRAALANLGMPLPGNGPTVPTVFSLDLTQPRSFFQASRFRMEPEDIIFVSNAPATDLAKFLSLVLPAAYSAEGFNSGFR